MSTDTHLDLFGYTYEDVDPSEIPARPHPTSPGRTAAPNPHIARLKSLAGTCGATAFRVPLEDESDESEVKRVLGRHTRWLRSAAVENGRGARIWSTVEDGALKICFQDIHYTARPRKPKPEPLFLEGSPE